MNKLHELNFYEIWTDGKVYNVYDPYALAGKFKSEIAALEWVAKVPDGKGDNIGPVKHARHIAKCLLKERLIEAKEMADYLEKVL